MKKTVAIFVCFCSVSIFLFGQDLNNDFSHGIKSSEGIKQKLDSIMTEEFDEESMQWNYTNKLIYKYDNHNNPSQYTFFNKEDSSLWKGVVREEYSYDALGILTHHHSFSMNEISRHWNLYGLTEYTYDNEGNKVLMISSTIRAIDSTWIPSNKSEYTYDASGNMTLQIDYSRNDAGSIWIGDDKEEYTFNEDDNMIQEIHYYWDKDVFRWVNSWRQDYTHNSDKKLSQLIGYLWDESLNTWVAWDKSIYTFDDIGNMVLHLSYDIDPEADIWREQYKFEYTYDSYGNMIEHVMYRLGLEANDWIPMERDVYQFDINYTYSDLIISGMFAEFFPLFRHMLVKVRNYDWDDTENLWIEESNIRFFFSDALYSGINKNPIPGIKVFPNPAFDIIHIELSIIPGKMNFTLFDMQGQKVISEDLWDNNNQISIIHIESGIYFYRVLLGTQTQTGKIIFR